MKPLCIRGSLGQAFNHIRAKILRVRQLIGFHSDPGHPDSFSRVPSQRPPVNMARAPDTAAPEKKRCQICLEVADEKEFTFRCVNCGDGYYCAACLRKWFLDACRNESKMPPKCCSVIPIKAVHGLLNDAEVSRRNFIYTGCALRVSKSRRLPRTVFILTLY